MLHVILPADWVEVPHQSPREFRNTARFGSVQISLLPPLPQLSAAPDQLLPWLQAYIRSRAPELHDLVREHEVECTVGRGAFSLRRSVQQGLVAFWVIASDVLVFATYVSGSPEV